MTWKEISIDADLMLDDDFFVSLRRCEDYRHVIPIHAYIGACSFDEVGEVGEVDDFDYTLAVIQGGIFDLNESINALDAGCGQWPDHYDETCFIHLYKNGLTGNKRRNGGYLKKDVMEKIGCEDGRIIYIDRVTVHPQIASGNFGQWFLLKTLELIEEATLKWFPVIAVLGSHREETRKGEVVAKYFQRMGFEKIHPEDESVYYLHPHIIEDQLDENPKPPTINIRSKEIADKKRKT